MIRATTLFYRITPFVGNLFLIPGERPDRKPLDYEQLLCASP